ncbi:hypothetical protein D3C73_884350 [compost metagenome]
MLQGPIDRQTRLPISEFTQIEGFGEERAPLRQSAVKVVVIVGPVIVWTAELHPERLQEGHHLGPAMEEGLRSGWGDRWPFVDDDRVQIATGLVQAVFDSRLLQEGIVRHPPHPAGERRRASNDILLL